MVLNDNLGIRTLELRLEGFCKECVKSSESYDLTSWCAPLEISTLNLLRVDSDFRFPASALRGQGDLSEGREQGAVSAP